MLIIEGPDLVGKSTMIESIMKDPFIQDNGYMPCHFTRLSRGFTPEHYLPRMSHRIVQDRFYVSDCVYARVRGDEAVYDDANFQNLHRELHFRAHGFQVLITCESCVYEKRVKRNKRGEMYDHRQNLKVNELFLQFGKSGNMCGFFWTPDFWIHCTKDSHYPNEGHIHEVLRRYKDHIREAIQEGRDLPTNLRNGPRP